MGNLFIKKTMKLLAITMLLAGAQAEDSLLAGLAETATNAADAGAAAANTAATDAATTAANAIDALGPPVSAKTDLAKEATAKANQAIKDYWNSVYADETTKANYDSMDDAEKEDWDDF